MKRRALLLLLTGFLSVAAAFTSVHAADCGSGGSPSNSTGSCETSTNQVHCGPGQGSGGLVVSNSTSGAEICNEGTTLPLQGRIGAQEECQCAYIDGDADNYHDNGVPLNGWTRIDSGGVHCAERGKPNNESYNSATGGPLIGGCVVLPVPY